MQAVQAVYDRIRSEAQQILISFTHALEGQLRTIDTLIGASSSAQPPPFDPQPQTPCVTPIIRDFSPIIRDFFKHSFDPNPHSSPAASQPPYAKRPRRATQPGPQQQSPYIAMPHIVITQLTAEETAVWRYCTRRPTRKAKGNM